MGHTYDTAQAVFAGSELKDIIVSRKGRTFPMLGEAGSQRELSFLPTADVFGGDSAAGLVPQETLPVLIGSGTGAVLEELVARLTAAHGSDFDLAVVDKEVDILAANALQKRFAAYTGIVWITQALADDALKALTHWQEKSGGQRLHSCLNPFYLRLDRDYYSAMKSACDASQKANFWDRAVYAKFRSEQPRILLLTSKYFLMGEIEAACKRLGIAYYLLQLPDGEFGQHEFVEQLLTAVIEFKPDFAFTINHLGVDREGILVDLLERLRLPLASWFVDNPHLVLSLYERLASPWTTLFTWDADNIPSLQSMGFDNVLYLPLGVDTTRFTPQAHASSWKKAFPAIPDQWNGNVSFVGNSMVSKVAARKGRTDFPQELLDGYRDIAAGFAESDERSVRTYLATHHPDKLTHFDALGTVERQLGYETMLTWEATLQYRLSCVESMLPFTPLIVGDTGWQELLQGSAWHYHSEMNYYKNLPVFYPCAAINFNCTSKQMKGAVNQRVFDVPATGAFLLTDYREQVENLFEVGKEIICYHSPEEATALAERYLAAPKERQAVADAARKRILHEHTYERRMQTLIAKMQVIYG